MVKEVKLNKFEKTRLVSARAEEIAFGDKPKVKVEGVKKGRVLTQDYVKVAEAEFDKGKLELEIKK